MKLFKMVAVSLFVFAVTVLSILACVASTYGVKANFNQKWIYGGKTFDIHDGIINSKTGTVKDDVAAPKDVIATSITPNVNSALDAPIGIKHTSVSGMNIPLDHIKYVRYRYYYEGDYSGRAKLTFPKAEFNLTRERSVYSIEEVVKGEWAYLTFDVESVLFGYIFPEGKLVSMMMYPFGDSAVNTLSEGSMYLAEIGIFGEENVNVLAAKSNGTLVQKYPVAFVPGRPDTQGTAPDTVFAEEGETIILPENTFVREGYTFNGWICSVGSMVMQPGDEYTLKTRTRTGGQVTAAVDFIANWVLNSDTVERKLPDVVRANVAAYLNGIVDGHKYKYGSYAENVNFDGFVTAKFMPDHNGAHAKTSNIMLDSYAWRNLPLDLAHYKYLIIPYYFKTERESVAYMPRMVMLGGATDDDRALTKSCTFYDYSGIKTNQWALMVFTFDFENNSNINQLLKWDELTIQNQIHFYPFGSTKASALLASDELYLADFIFLSEIPSSRPTFSKGILSGDGNGYFRPNDFLTKAEAASMLAKFLGYAQQNGTDTGYSDIASHWCLPYVSFLEEKGALRPSAKEKFYPEDLCTSAEFLTFITNSASNGVKGTSDFGSLPKIGNNEKYLSRAVAVNLISSVVNDTNYTSADAVKYLKGQKLYTDTDNNQWYYPAIALNSVPTVSFKENGTSKVIDTFIDEPEVSVEFPEEKFDEADKYMQTLDTLTEKRIFEIRNSKSEYKQKAGGKTVYVSNTMGSGTVESSSESNPVHIDSIGEISSFKLYPGDVVLLKRGEVYRGCFTAIAGVTYSAYGEGDKPVITPSPENGTGSSKWILDYEDKDTGKKIWKFYREDLADIGGINLISSDGTHLVAYKEIPNYYDGKFFKRYNSAEEFIYTEELDKNFEFVHLANKSTNGVAVNSNPDTNAVGPIYLRCDEGNPGKLYPSIEFNANFHAIRVGGVKNVTIDNLCLKYFGRHGISAGTTHNLVVTNCEIGWGGGSIQSYKDGRVTRFGNGVEIYGALVNYIIDNCYVYEIYDAGITHQISSSSLGHYYMEGVYYTDNVLINSTYNIEYFMSKNAAGSDGKTELQERYMKDVYFIGNITRGAGYGWGVQRPDNAPSNVKGWTHHNLCDNQVYENNIFDRCVDLQNFSTDYVIMTGSTYESSTPYLKNNIFVQTPGRTLMYYGKSTYECNPGSEELINTIGGDGNKVYFARDDSDEYKGNVFWKY